MTKLKTKTVAAKATVLKTVKPEKLVPQGVKVMPDAPLYATPSGWSHVQSTGLAGMYVVHDDEQDVYEIVPKHAEAFTTWKVWQKDGRSCALFSYDARGKCERIQATEYYPYKVWLP